MLAVPFVLYSQPTGVFETNGFNLTQMSEEAHRRYAEIMRDIEVMIDDQCMLLLLISSSYTIRLLTPSPLLPRAQNQVYATAH